jgi:hypothetical protein
MKTIEQLKEEVSVSRGSIFTKNDVLDILMEVELPVQQHHILTNGFVDNIINEVSQSIESILDTAIDNNSDTISVEETTFQVVNDNEIELKRFSLGCFNFKDNVLEDSMREIKRQLLFLITQVVPDATNKNV